MGWVLGNGNEVTEMVQEICCRTFLLLRKGRRVPLQLLSSYAWRHQIRRQLETFIRSCNKALHAGEMEAFIIIHASTMLNAPSGI